MDSARPFRCTDTAARAPCARRIRCRRSSTRSPQGVDALELDMAVTRDNVLVVSHDPVLEAPVCTGPQRKRGDPRTDAGSGPRVGLRGETESRVPEATGGAGDAACRRWTKSSRWRPKGKFLFNIETKIFPQKPELTPPPEEFARMVLAAIRKHHLESRVVLQSLRFPHADRDEEAGAGDQALGAVCGAAEGFRGDRQGGGRGDRFADCASGDAGAGEGGARGGYGSAAVDGKHACGMGTPGNAGVDGIISDDPAALIAWLKANGKR